MNSSLERSPKKGYNQFYNLLKKVFPKIVYPWISMDLSEAMDLPSSQVRLEAKLETLAESLEEKKKEYSIKEFEVSLKKNNLIPSFMKLLPLSGESAAV